MPQARDRRHHAARVLPLRLVLGLRCSRDPTVLPGVAAVWIPAGDGRGPRRNLPESSADRAEPQVGHRTPTLRRAPLPAIDDSARCKALARWSTGLRQFQSRKAKVGSSFGSADLALAVAPASIGRRRLRETRGCQEQVRNAAGALAAHHRAPRLPGGCGRARNFKSPPAKWTWAALICADPIRNAQPCFERKRPTPLGRAGPPARRAPLSTSVASAAPPHHPLLRHHLNAQPRSWPTRHAHGLRLRTAPLA